MSDTYLVTGAMGCIGAWTLYHLVKQGKKAVSFDLSDDRSRLNLLLTPDEEAAMTFVKGDLTDFKSVLETLEQHSVNHVIHLAALQVPFCRANPVLGAQVNVVGTVNVFEAAKQAGLRHVVYASSVAVYGPAEDYPPGLVAHDAPFLPRTHYGVYKVANEGTAKVYWYDHGVSSTTLRPYTIYGVARDQGLTSEPTKAMLAAAAGQSYHISFGGRMQFNYASDVARQFIEAADNPLNGAYGFNPGGVVADVAEFAVLIGKLRPGVTVTNDETILPFPVGGDGAEYRKHLDSVPDTPLEDGIRETIAHFEQLLAEGRIAAPAAQ